MNNLSQNQMLGYIFQLPIAMMLAYIMDKLVGDPRWFPHPVVYMGKLISRMEKVIRKGTQSPKGLKWGGLLLWVITVGTTFLVTTGILFVGYKLHFYLGFALQTLILWTGIAAKSLYVESDKVYQALEAKDIKKARQQIGYLVGRDTTKLKEDDIVRAAVETVAENTVDGVTAPLFYAMMGGAPLMMAYKAINTLDSMVGYKNEKYKDLGYFSATIDDIANYIPARFSLIGFIFGAAIKGYAHRDVQRIVMRDYKNHKSPNAGWSEAAMAGALGIQLGGNNVYFGELVEKPTIGDKTRDLETMDIRRAGDVMRKTSDMMLFVYVLMLVVATMQRYHLTLF